MKIPFNLKIYSELERDYVNQALSSGKSSGNGLFGRQCEDLISSITGNIKTLLTPSCTHALEMCAVLISGATDRTEVVVPSYTFSSTAEAFALHGLKPVFCDVDSRTFNIDIEDLESKVSERTAAVCVVHYGGIGVDMRAVESIARPMGAKIVEDNAHGFLGARWGQPLGTFGDYATLSFHETKNISCGEGGALLVSERSVHDRVEIIREKGTDRSKFLRGQVDKYTWIDHGSSWVQSEVLAALLLGQLERRKEIQQIRESVFNSYQVELKNWCDENAIGQPMFDSSHQHPSHLFFLVFKSLKERTSFMQHMRTGGVDVAFHYQALNASPMGMRLGGFAGQCPVAEMASDCLVRLPIFDTMTEVETERVIELALTFDDFD